ncbi:uncharacterized protein kek5 [Drosophila montana]|uniref:uncharacterized protein kek5 n=1 Tax=Drosophila montana TaxID=40370 RepID=UPI00313EF1B8
MAATMLRLLLASLVLLLVMLAQESLGHRDWMQNCSNCHCHWNSGKKSADCKGKKLTKIPLEMSNEMQVVDFSQNQIPELRRDEFQVAGLQNLHKIYLRNCTIQEVNRDAFKGLAILIELDMSSNRISQLHPNTFEGLEKLRNVIINNNEIEILESRLFINLPFLSRVEFNNNRLKQVQLNVFGGPLTAISLEQNQLTHLHKETFDNLPKLTYLSLQGNAWNCSCDLQQFRDFAMAKRLYTPPTDCREPAQLRGKLWSEVPSENFACRPRIIGSVRSFVEANHDNVTLPCRIVGTPRPNVTWIYNKRQLNPNPNDHHIRILNSVEQQQQSESGQIMTSELRIYGVRNSDKGAYICVADNRGGKAEAEFQLLVNGDYMGASSGSDGMGGLGISGAIGASTSDPQTSIFLVICVIVTTFLVLLIFLVLTLFWYCRRVKTYQKDNTMMSGDGLISCKLDKTHNSSMLEGSVIMEMQKSLLNEVNPVEKPPRRTDIESVDGGDDNHEIKKTLLDETAYANHTRDDETHSVALSDTTITPRSRHTYVDDTYGNSLPPDLLAFPARVPPTSPSMQSSQSNIPDQIIYGIRSPPPPLTSPVYAHMTPHGIYGTTTIATANHNGFMTLQHPKTRNLALIATANSRHQQQQQLAAAFQQQQQQQQQQLGSSSSSSASPFLPAPVVYSPASAVVMKQGYMTIPRKPRVPSWAPSTSNAAAAAAQLQQLGEFQSPTSPNPSETGTATTVELQAEPVYDNLGLRTTAGGNSTLNLHKAQSAQAALGGQGGGNGGQQYSMRDRPLPATPSLTSVASTSASTSASASVGNASKIYEPIHELIQQQQAMQAAQQQQQQAQQQQQQQQQQHLYNSETEPLYGGRLHGITILPGSSISGAGLGSPSSTLGGAGGSPTPMAMPGGESPKMAKIPPRPPPKPKKKMSVTATRSGQGSTSQLFDDEGEDGTEV